MFGGLAWQIARRYLRARRKEGYISFIALISYLGIALGVATLIVVMAVMNGFRADLLDRILGVTGHIVVHHSSGKFTDDNIIEQFKSIQGVKLVTPLIDGQVMLSVPSSNQVQGVLVRAMPPEDLQKLPALEDNVEAGSLNLTDNQVAIGARMAEKYGLAVGDELSLIAPRGMVTPFGVSPRIKRYIVGAIFSIGLSEYDANIIMMTQKAGGILFDKSMQEGVLEITLNNAEQVDAIIPTLRDMAGGRYSFISWRQSNGTLAGALEVERNVMFLILSLILLVAALNIVSGLVMLVRDKARDIAVLRAMGASRGMIVRIFLITGASIGVAGTISGVVLGVVFCHYIEEVRQILMSLTGAELFPPNVYFLDKMPARIEVQETLNIIFMSLGLSFISTLYPAWRAASYDPVEALRYE